jgi:sulfur-carrier protein adenylyltransferase/sulfurtransferase
MSIQDASRFSRQMTLPQVGEAGQTRIQNGRVLIVGIGGLGCPAALYLAAAGVGKLGLVDPDQVALSNLQRQILYTPADLGQNKVLSAAEKLLVFNPNLQIKCFAQALTAENAEMLIKDWDVVIDGSDQIAVRYLLNAACNKNNIPFIYGSIYRFSGQVSVFQKPGPCYRCLFPDPPAKGSIPDCNQGGVLGAIAGLVGTIQALESLKVLLGLDSLAGQLLLIDGLEMQFEKIALSRAPDCLCCGKAPQPLHEFANQRIMQISPVKLHAWIASQSQLQLLDVRTPNSSDPLKGRNLPLEELSQHLYSLEQGAPILVYCQRGIRSTAAAELLLEAGFTQVYNLQGGLDNLND